MMQEHRHYDYVARAIHFLQTHHTEQPGLDALAAHVHLSPVHLQRVFSEWAGLSPKKFLQFLTLEHARSLLMDGATVEEATQQVGLSGSGRLHDLFVTIEGMTPGELRRGGESLRIRTGLYDTRFGPLFLAATSRGLCAALFLDEENPQESRRHRGHAWLQQRFPRAEIACEADDYQRAALAWFDGVGPERRPLSLHLRGSPFQLKVWECLLRVPAGRLASYAQIAAGVEQPGAARAVGSAIGGNPVALLIPCHRVIRSSGALGGYRWGLPRKAALIAWESSRTHASEDTGDRPDRYNSPLNAG